MAFRNVILLFLSCTSVCLFTVTDAAAGRYGLHRAGWGWRGPEIIAGVGPGFANGLHDYPDGGYGEYAEYGPWIYRNIYGCHSIRQRVRTEDGWLYRLLQICD
jgi:hypothetical protein